MSDIITEDSVPLNCPDCPDGSLEYIGEGLTPIDGETASGRVACDSCEFTGVETWSFENLRRSD